MPRQPKRTSAIEAAIKEHPSLTSELRVALSTDPLSAAMAAELICQRWPQREPHSGPFTKQHLGEVLEEISHDTGATYSPRVQNSPELLAAVQSHYRELEPLHRSIIWHIYGTRSTHTLEVDFYLTPIIMGLFVCTPFCRQVAALIGSLGLTETAEPATAIKSRE